MYIYFRPLNITNTKRSHHLVSLHQTSEAPFKHLALKLSLAKSDFTVLCTDNSQYQQGQNKKVKTSRNQAIQQEIQKTSRTLAELW